jgi:cytochrome c-type biogenesis protein CcmH
MILFWALGALLAALALLVVLLPRNESGVSGSSANIAIYRDQLRELERDLAAGTLAQADYDRARRELEARLLEDVAEAPAAAERRGARALPALLAICVPLLAAGVYFLVGNPAAVDRQADQALAAQQVEAMVARLAARLREDPDDVQGWKLLGRSYLVLGRFSEAADAYARAAVRAPRDAQLLADFADALAMARGQRLEGEPEKLVQRALEIDPANLKALALAGTAAFDRKDYAAAATYWQRMLPHVPADSEHARAIQANVEQAKGKLAVVPLRGTVRIAPELKGKVSPDDTVFVFALAKDGPPMPLAVLRKQVRDLPLAFALDDSMAMTPAMKLSGFPRVVVGARVSKSGNATPQPGDLQGASAAVANDAEGVTVLIDTVVRAD